MMACRTFLLRFVLTCMMVFLSSDSGLCLTRDETFKEVLADPAITYRASFSMDTTEEIWRKMMANPYLMGKIWEAYGFDPPYKVTRIESRIHVLDPTGFSGEILKVEISRNTSVIYGKGKFDHWAVPSAFSATGVIVFRCKPDPKGLSGKVEIYIRGDHLLTNLLIRLASEPMMKRIESGFARKMQNVGMIVSDIMNRPEKVQKMLAGPILLSFKKVFLNTD
jgi:hypothetical protein